MVRSNRSALAVLFLAPVMAVVSAATSAAQSQVVAWGRNDTGQCNVPLPPPGLSYTKVSARGFYGVGLRNDGSIVAWGSNLFGQLNVPALPPGLTYIDIAAGNDHVLARRSDGSAAAWGYNAFGQCAVPALPAGLTYVEVAAGYWHSLARRSDNLVVAWGQNTYGQCNVPALPPGLSYVELSAGNYHTLARRSDGSVVAWGRNSEGQCNVPALPVGIVYVEVSAGLNFSAARRSDGAVLAWGVNNHGQCIVPALPSGLSYLEVSAGGYHAVARRSNGTAVAWGWDNYGQIAVPTLPAGRAYTSVSAGEYQALAITNPINLGGGELGDYRFENGVAGSPATQPGSILDSSPAGVNGTPIGGPTWTNDVAANNLGCDANSASLEFDGVDDWVHFNSPFPLNVPADATLACWIRVPEQAHRAIFWANDPQLGDTNRFHFFTYTAANSPGLGLDYRTPSGMLHTLLPADGYTFVVPDDAWTHVAVTRVVESPLAHTYRFYKDGALVYTATDSNPDLPTSTQWTLAGRPPPSQRFTGTLDEIRISNHALSPNEILMGLPPTTYCTTGTTTHGCSPSISGMGSPSASQVSGFTISVAGVEGQRNGLVFYGMAPTAVTWGVGNSSYLCVASPVQRTPIINSGGNSGGCDGALAIDFNSFVASNPTALGSPFVQGQTYYAQAWFRDPSAPKGTNLSGGLRFTLCE